MGRGSGVTTSRPEYEVRLQPIGAREFRRLHGRLRDRVSAAVDALAADPRPAGVVKLARRDDYRIRVDAFRIVYAVDDAEKLILVARIAHRREVYRR